MRVKVAVLAICMLVTGTINTIATKYQDITVVGSDAKGQPIYFQHPAVQSACMFLGESLCLIPYFYLRWRRQRHKRLNLAYVPLPYHEKRSRRIQRILAFAVPTLADACGTTLMNVGLFFTYASTYQMLRGTLVLFAGMFTVLILRRQLYTHHWLGMVLITAGAALVGASSVIYAPAPAPTPPSNSMQPGALGLSTLSASSTSAAEQLGHFQQHAVQGAAAIQHPHTQRLGSPWGLLARLREGDAAAAAPLFGDILVVMAQMFTALQFIMEEKFLVNYKVPALLAVGLEGCWGLALSLLVLPVTSAVRGPDGLPLDDALAALRQIFSIRSLGTSVAISILSIAFFNFFGVSVTKSLSGAARATIDACRTLFIWLVSMHIGWEQFHMLEVVGFVVLISGSSLYNEILKSCLSGGGRPPSVAAQVEPGQQRRRSRAAADGNSSSSPAPADDEEAGAADATLRQPLLAGPREGLPVPVGPAGTARPHPAAQAALVATPGEGSAGEWLYTMARSMRLGMHALSPKSLASGALADQCSSVSSASYLGGEGPLGTSYSTPTAGGALGRQSSFSSLGMDAGEDAAELPAFFARRSSSSNRLSDSNNQGVALAGQVEAAGPSSSSSGGGSGRVPPPPPPAAAAAAKGPPAGGRANDSGSGSGPPAQRAGVRGPSPKRGAKGAKGPWRGPGAGGAPGAAG